MEYPTLSPRIPLEISVATVVETKSAGRGMEIPWGVGKSPFGKCFIAQSPHGISHLSFFDGDEADSLEAVRKDWPEAALRRDDRLAASLLKRIFQNTPDEGLPLRLHLKGTDFQMKVWNALLEIPEGETCTYGRLARQLGMAGAARAVGNAVGRNRIAYLIPCHRVIRENGEQGGYRWGQLRKRTMLQSELSAPAPSRRHQ